MKLLTHKGYTIEYNQKPFVSGHDYDVYKDGEEENGFTAANAEQAIEIIDEKVTMLNIDCMEYMKTLPDFVGCEIDQDYHQSAVARFERETAQLDMWGKG